MAQDVGRIETTCASSINMVGTIIKDWYQTPKTGLKIMLVSYHLKIKRSLNNWLEISYLKFTTIWNHGTK